MILRGKNRHTTIKPDNSIHYKHGWILHVCFSWFIFVFLVNTLCPVLLFQKIPNERAQGVLGDVENLTEEKIDELVKEFLKDFKEGSVEAKGWPTFLPAYTVSKVAVNAYTRILAKKYPSFCINSVCPGNVKSDLNANTWHRICWRRCCRTCQISPTPGWQSFWLVFFSAGSVFLLNEKAIHLFRWTIFAIFSCEL